MALYNVVKSLFNDPFNVEQDIWVTAKMKDKHDKAARLGIINNCTFIRKTFETEKKVHGYFSIFRICELERIMLLVVCHGQ